MTILLMTTEAIFWMIYILTGEKLKKVKIIAKKLHKKRKYKLIEFANDINLYETYEGPDEKFLDWVQIQAIKTTICLIAIFCLILFACYLDDPTLY